MKLKKWKRDRDAKRLRGVIALQKQAVIAAEYDRENVAECDRAEADRILEAARERLAATQRRTQKRTP